jgi:porin
MSRIEYQPRRRCKPRAVLAPAVALALALFAGAAVAQTKTDLPGAPEPTKAEAAKADAATPGPEKSDTEPSRPVRFSAAYKIDLMSVMTGGVERGSSVLDNLSANLDVDFDAAFGWRGATAHVSLLSNHGGHPAEKAGSMQGVDNIEVAHARTKIYEAWIDQSFADGAADLRAGLSDTNSEFNVTDSSGVFLAPIFGVTSELAASGPAGPSIFPSTALAVRLNLQPSKDVYVRAAVINAQAGTIGDPGGVDTHFDKGALVIGEAGWTAKGKFAVGAWTYTDRQPDLRDTTPEGEPARSASHGVYALADTPLIAHDNGAQVSAFLRLGASDGDTTPYKGSVAAGISASRVVPGRPDAQLAAAVFAGRVSNKFRANGADAGQSLARAETGFELTYADKLGEHMTIQPDLQFIHHPSADRSIPDAWVVGLRGTVTF